MIFMPCQHHNAAECRGTGGGSPYHDRAIRVDFGIDLHARVRVSIRYTQHYVGGAMTENSPPQAAPLQRSEQGVPLGSGEAGFPN
jgi:hypothetical protein